MMDGRFEGLDRVREGIESGRHELPAVCRAGCPDRQRVRRDAPLCRSSARAGGGLAFEHEHHFECSRRYGSRGWRDAGSTSASGSEAEPRPEALAASRSVGIARFVALNTLGWLRAAAGEDDVWPLLDEALAIAREIGHLQRLWPVAVARAEAGSRGRPRSSCPVLEEVLELARAVPARDRGR